MAVSASLFFASAPSPFAFDTAAQLQTAFGAYAAGELGAASLALTEARKALDVERGAKLAAVFPPAPEGWTLEVSDIGAVMAVMGGGAGADANYTKVTGAMSRST